MNIDQAIFNAIYRGRKFRKPKGQRKFIAECLHIDRSYQEYYNFVITGVRMRNLNTHKSEYVDWNRFQKEWVRVDPLPDEEQKLESAIDSVLGVPFYRQ